MFWRVYGKCIGVEWGGRRINPPLFDLLPTRGDVRHANEGNVRIAGTPGEEIPTYRNQSLPAKIQQSQGVTAFLDDVQVLPQIHVFLDPPSSLL